MLAKLLSTVCVAISCAVLGAADDSEFSAYSPRPEGSHLFLETFQDLEGVSLGKFVKSEIDKYADQPVSLKEDNGGFDGDYVMNLEKGAKHYGLSAKFDRPAMASDSIVMQYEVRFHEGLDCGGAYVKMLAEESLPNLANVDDQTPYVIMFGPDKCGTTKKIHFIMRHKNPVSGEWEEKHLKSPPSWNPSPGVQLFTLVVSSDDTFSIMVNSKEVASGSLLEDFDPPVNPQKQIDDPEDEKPQDWVDEAKIADADASKPDDWDEDAPAQIEDPDASMPDGWLVEQDLQIPDPTAVAPEDWDEEEDGEWEAPIVSNTKCSVGCGPWTHPMIVNPEFKGKWSAPLIDNPAYIGEWSPKQIENPNYFHVTNVAATLEPMSAVALEIWTMNGNMAFDNFLVTNNVEVAADFADMTSSVKVEMHKEANEREQAERKQKHMDNLLDGSIGGYVQYAMAQLTQNPLYAIGFVVLSILVSFFLSKLLCGNCCSGPRQEYTPPSTRTGDAAKATKEAEAAPATTDEAEATTTTDEAEATTTTDEAEATPTEEVVGETETDSTPSTLRKRSTKPKRRSKRTPRAE